MLAIATGLREKQRITVYLRVDIDCTLSSLGPAVRYTDFHPRYGVNVSVLGGL